jgi:hypothetical protein
LFAFLLCFFAFVFWKLDQRTKTLIKNAEDTLKYFEKTQPHTLHTKLFLYEEKQTDEHWDSLKGWRKLMIWRWPLSYSKCFNFVYAAFFLTGLWALTGKHLWWMQWCWQAVHRLLWPFHS